MPEKSVIIFSCAFQKPTIKVLWGGAFDLKLSGRIPAYSHRIIHIKHSSTELSRQSCFAKIDSNVGEFGIIDENGLMRRNVIGRQNFQTKLISLCIGIHSDWVWRHLCSLINIHDIFVINIAFGSSRSIIVSGLLTVLLLRFSNFNVFGSIKHFQFGKFCCVVSFSSFQTRVNPAKFSVTYLKMRVTKIKLNRLPVGKLVKTWEGRSVLLDKCDSQLSNQCSRQEREQTSFPENVFKLCHRSRVDTMFAFCR